MKVVRAEVTSASRYREAAVQVDDGVTQVVVENLPSYSALLYARTFCFKKNNYFISV